MSTHRTRSLPDSATGPPRDVRAGTGLLPLALTLGLAGGLVEGFVHIGLQTLGVLDNSWYQIIWIAAVVNATVMAGLASLSLAIPPIPGAWFKARTLAVFSIALVAFLPWLSLLLKEWIESYAIFLLLLGLSVAFTRWFTGNEGVALPAARRGLPWLAVATFVAFASIDGAAWWEERVATRNLPPAAAGAPDVIVLILDALRADHLSSYGYERPTSPTLDRLAAEGVLFESAFATSSYTLPSHASILTGRYLSQHGVEWQSSKVLAEADYPVLPEVMQTLGYRTAAFSANTFWFAREHGFARGFLHFDDYFHSAADRVMRTAYGRIAARTVWPRLNWKDIPARRRAPSINQAFLEWATRDAERPFLGVLNYMDVHDPYLPPEPYRSQFSRAASPGGLLNWQFHVPDRLGAEDLQAEIDAYDGAIAYVDSQIDALLAALASRERNRDVLVIVTSDHGDEFYEHGGFLHGAHLYREVLQVPLIVWSPGRVPAGVRVETPVTNASIPATIMEALGNPSTFPAPPLKPLWAAAEAPAAWPPPLADLRHRPWAKARTAVQEGSLRSAVSGTFHYIEHATRDAELYEWTVDPRESRNLARDQQRHAVIERFKSLLASPLISAEERGQVRQRRSSTGPPPP